MAKTTVPYRCKVKQTDKETVAKVTVSWRCEVERTDRETNQNG